MNTGGGTLLNFCFPSFARACRTITAIVVGCLAALALLVAPANGADIGSQPAADRHKQEQKAVKADGKPALAFEANHAGNVRDREGPVGVTAEVIVYAATPSGIMAAIAAADLGQQVVLLEPGQHVGGVVSSGLGFSDVYDLNAIGGLAKTFFRTVSSIYASTGIANSNGGLEFEPHIAEQAFLQMLGQRSNLQVVYGAELLSLQMSGATIVSLTTTDGSIYTANEFVDASYEGDLMAAAHVSYTIGREASSQYNEPYAGVDTPHLPNNVIADPYVSPGDLSSGLLPHVIANNLPAPGSADSRVMAYNYRLCVSSGPNNRIPFTAPANYDAAEFEVLARQSQAVIAAGSKLHLVHFLTLKSLPNNKFDVNSGSLMSTDYVGANTSYVGASSEERQGIAAEHKRYTQALLYFLITDSRIPTDIQAEIQALGLCKDEFIDNGGWPRQLYVREARRMSGSYVMTQDDVELRTNIPEPVGLGGFPFFDNHQIYRIADEGAIKYEPTAAHSVDSPYPIAYRSLTPKESEASNLLVSVAISASHVAFTTLRVEPTYMIMGQAAGTAAALASRQQVPVQSVDYTSLQMALTSAGQVLSYTPSAPPSAASVTPNSGTGMYQNFSFTYSDAAGYDNLFEVFTLINSTWDLGGACGTYYEPLTNRLRLRDDTGDEYLPAALLGAPGTLENSQCSIDTGASSVSGSGNDLTVTLAISFQPSFAGMRTIYMYARTRYSASGWQSRGTWTVPAQPPTAVSVTPDRGSGTTQSFTFFFSDAAGYRYLSSVFTLINSTWNLAGACGTSYSPATKQLQLRDDTGAGYVAAGTLGSSGRLENSQCSIDLATSTASGSGNNLSLKLATTFKPSFTGNKVQYLFARNKAGLGSGWQSRGTWTIPAQPPSAVSVTPSAGTGATQTFTFAYSDPAGYGYLASVFTLINSTWKLAEACGTSYDPASNQLRLRDDSGTDYLPAASLGSPGTLENSQCSINLSASSVIGSGNNLALTLATTFKPSFTGAKAVYVLARNKAGLPSGWQNRGSWLAAASPAAVSVAPNAGTGATQTFTFVYSDPAKYEYLSSVFTLINSTWNLAGGCGATYDRVTNTLRLRNDTGSGYLEAGMLGSPGTVENSQCMINLAASTATGSGNELTLTLATTFKPGFVGSKTVYMYARNKFGLGSDWQSRGTWTVP